MAEDTNYFIEDLQQNVDYFGVEDTTVPMKTEKAAEAGTVAGILSTGTVTTEGLRLGQQVQSNMELFGDDPVYKQLSNKEKETLKGSVKEQGVGVLAESTSPQDDLLTIQGSLDAIDRIPDRHVMNTIAAESQANPSNQYSFLFEDVVNQAMVESSMSDLISIAQQETDFTVGDWAEVFTIAPATERSFRVEVLDRLGLREGTTDYAFRAGDETAVVDWIRNAPDTNEMITRMESFVDAAKDAESFLGGNGIFTVSFLDQVKEQLNYGTDKKSALLDDFFDIFVPADAAGLASITGVKYLASRILGKASAVSKGADVKTFDDLRQMTQDTADIIMPRPMQQTKVSQAVASAVRPQRTNKGSFFDSMYMSNPDMVKAALSASEGDALAITKTIGLTPEQLAERLTPASKGEGSGAHISTLTGRHGTSPARSEYDVTIPKDIEDQLNRVSRQSLYSQQELTNGVRRELDKVRDQSSGVLQPHMVDIPNIVEDSDEITFGAIFGKTYSKGYESLDEAKDAGSYLFQTETPDVLARRVGTNDQPQSLDNFDDGAELEYFIQAKLNHTVVPMDANPFGEQLWGSFAHTDYLIPWSNRISNDMYNTITGFTDRTSSMAERMTKLVDPLRKLKGSKDKELWTKLMMHGDQHQMVFNKAMANEYLGGQLNDRIWNAYESSRQYFDVLHEVRNKKEYLRLSEENFKTITADGKPFKDSKGQVFGKPVVDLQQEGISELVDTSGNVLPYTDDLAARIQDQGGVIVKTNRDITMDGENYYSHVVVPRRDTITELPLNPLPKRLGHVDVYYRGEDSLMRQKLGGHKGGTGYIVSKSRPVKLNGRTSTREETVGIFASEPQARKWLAKQDDQEAYTISPSREKVSELGLDYSGSLSGLPSHALGRGNERLQGPNGLAEVLDPEEAIQATQNEIRTRLGVEVIDYLKSKWMRTYSTASARDDSGRAIINAFPPSKEGIVFDKAHQNKLPEATRWYDFIKNQENGLQGRINAKFMDDWRRSAEAMYNKDTMIYRGASRVLTGMLDKNYIRTMAKVNQFTAIATRVMYQTLANSTQVGYLGARDPGVFISQTLPRTLTTMMGLALRKGKNKDESAMMSLLGKSFGMKGEEFNKYLTQVEESGILSTGVADDIFSLLLNSTKVAAGDKALWTKEWWKKLPSRTLASPFVLPQEWATQFSNLTSYVHATNLYRKNNKTKNIFSNVARDEIQGTARKASFTQNRADQLAYQQNLSSVTFQFMHHVQKMFMNMVVDTSYKAITGRNLGKEGSNFYASTRAQSFITLGLIVGAFGSRNLLSGEQGDSLEASMEGLPDDVKTAVMDGWTNLGAEAIFGEKLDISSRFSPLDFHRQILDFMFTDDGGVNLLGPTSMTYRNLVDVWDWVNMHHNNKALSTEEFLTISLKEGSRVLAGLRDIDRARVAYNYGMYTTAEGRTIAEVDPMTSLPILFSVPPLKVKQFYDSMDSETETRDFVNRITDQALRAFMDDMRNNPNYTSTEIQESANKYLYQIVYPALGQDNPSLFDQARQRYTDFLFREDSEFLTNYADKLFKLSRTSDEAIQKLEKFKEQYPDQSERIDFYIQTLNNTKQQAQEEQQ